MQFGKDYVQAPLCAHLIGKDNIRPSSRHVGGNRDLPYSSGPRNDLGFFTCFLGVQRAMWNACLCQCLTAEE